MMHWAFDFVGKPWVYGARGPDEFDCWGFVAYVQRTRYGVDMLDTVTPTNLRKAHRLIETYEERRKWVRVDEPEEGDVVLMARNSVPVHIGLLVRANGELGVLHCIEKSGVVYQTKANLKISGWGQLSYYRRIV